MLADTELIIVRILLVVEFEQSIPLFKSKTKTKLIQENRRKKCRTESIFVSHTF